MLQEKTSALKRELTTFQNISYFLSIFVGHFGLLDPDPGSGFADLIESGSGFEKLFTSKALVRLFISDDMFACV
jgi:hypothetical protein